MRLWVQSLAWLSGLRIRVALSSGVGCKLGSDLRGCGCGVGPTAPIQPLAWESPYTVSRALKRHKTKNKKIKKIGVPILVQRKQIRLGT